MRNAHLLQVVLDLVVFEDLVEELLYGHKLLPRMRCLSRVCLFSEVWDYYTTLRRNVKLREVKTGSRHLQRCLEPGW